MWPRCPWKGPGQLSVPHEGSVLVKFLSECEQPGPGFREQGHPLGAPACLLAARGCTGRRGTPQASHTPATAPRETRVERASLAAPVGRLAAELLRGLPLYPTGPRASPVAHAAPRSVPRRLRPQLGVWSLWSLVPAPRAPACQRSACSGCQHPQESSIWRGGSDAGVVQGPDFWKSRAPCSRGCRAVCIAGTARSPLRRRPRCPRKQQPLPLAVQRPGWGWSAGLVLAVELSLPYWEGREVQAPAPLGPSGDSEPRPVPRGASCRAGAQRLPAPVPTPAPSACAPASPGPGQRVSGRRAHRRVPPTPCLCRRLCRVPRAAGRVLAAALGAAGIPTPVAGHLEAAARRVHSAL